MFATQPLPGRYARVRHGGFRNEPISAESRRDIAMFDHRAEPWPNAICLPALLEASCSVELFTEGDALYEAMVGAIASASTEVRLEIYIFADDEIGRLLAETLTERARHGVRVRVLLDASGSASSRSLARRLRRAGVELRWFHGWIWKKPFRYNRRDHRKLLVVDAARAYLGGFNIHRQSSRAFFGAGRWRDTHVAISGSLAVRAAANFDAVWNDPCAPLEPMREGSAMLVAERSRTCRRMLRCLHWAALREARRTAYLTTPYFVPDRRTLLEIAASARRGVDVRLLVPRRTDVPLARWAGFPPFRALLAAGVRVFEYLPRPLHAKTAVFDGELATVGTANLDYRSFFINRELNFVARDRTAAGLMQEQFLRDLGDSAELTLTTWSGSRFERAAGLLARPLRRWL